MLEILSWAIPTTLTSLIALYTIVILRKSLIQTKEHQSINLTNDYQKRYEAIKYDVGVADLRSNSDWENYYLKYWNLQFEQFEYFKKGYIDESIYTYWLIVRYGEYHENAKTGKMNYKNGWDFVSDKTVSTEFKSFMERVFNCANGNYKEVSSVLKYL